MGGAALAGVMGVGVGGVVVLGGATAVAFSGGSGGGIAGSAGRVLGKIGEGVGNVGRKISGLFGGR